MGLSGQTQWERSLPFQDVYKMRERLARIDKSLAKLYRYNAQVGQKINRIQRERSKLVQQLEKEEVRCGVRDPSGTPGV